MYCKNCGMKLPDWAHFCERCGARVGTDNAYADPIDLVGLDDTTASEPLWVTDDGAAGQPDAAAVGRAASRVANLETELMDPTENASYSSRGAHAKPASEAPVASGDTEYMEPLDATVPNLVQPATDAAGDSDAEILSADSPHHLDETDPDPKPDGTHLMDATDEDTEEGEDGAATDADATESDADESASDANSEQDESAGTDADSDDSAQEADSDANADADTDADPDADADSDADAVPAPDADAGSDSAPASNPDEAADPDAFPYWQRESYTYGEAPVYMGELAEDPDADPDEPRTVGMNSAMRHRTDAEWRQRQQQAGKIGGKSSTAAMLAPLAIAAIALTVGYFLLNGLINAVRTASPSIEESAQPTKSKRVSRGEAHRIIEALDGWWNTGRTFDGRYWHIEKGILYTFAADGEMVNEEEINETSVEHMDAGPGGIEGKGYYFRSVALYQLEDDPDTLYKIEQDGSANSEANLHRTDEPNFDEEPEEEEKKEEDPYAADFILPDSSRRIYDRAELDRLNNHDLWIAYSEIYARAGYKFNPEGELGKRFYGKEWYKPRDDFQWEDFNEVERENTSTMYALEQERGSEYLY